MKHLTLRDVVYSLPRVQSRIILHFNGGRVASYELNNDNLNMLKKIFRLSHIQTDVSGSIHYEILSINKEI